MIVTCDDCNAEFDDLDHRATCPHEPFDMFVTLVLGNGATSHHTTLGSVDATLRASSCYSKPSSVP